MVKLGTPFVRYNSTNNGGDTKIDSTQPSTPIKSKSSFTFITSGNSIRDYVKRKIFKATKEEVSSLLKSTSNLNLAGVFSSKSSSSSKSKKSKQTVKSLPSSIVNIDSEAKCTNNQRKSNDDDGQQKQICMNVEEIEKQTEEVTLSIDENDSMRVDIVESSTEVIEAPMVETIKPCRRFSLARLSKRKKKKARFAEDLTQSLPASCSTSVPSEPESPCVHHKGQSKFVKWSKKMRKCKSKSCDSMAIGKVSNVKTGGNVKGDEKEAKDPVKWTKRFRKFAFRACRYLGYSAQMVSPLTPYTDIPMPVTYDGYYNVYPPYYGADPYYSYSSCGSVYGYKMSHYGLTY